MGSGCAHQNCTNFVCQLVSRKPFFLLLWQLNTLKQETTSENNLLKWCIYDFSVKVLIFYLQFVIFCIEVVRWHQYVICSIFEFGGVTKHFMTGPMGNSEFCFP